MSNPARFFARTHFGGRIGRIALLSCGASAFSTTGCYESHLPALPGERYECGCEWEVRIPCEASTECTIDSSGDLVCEPTVTCGSGGDTEHRSRVIHPCRTYIDDPETVCAVACGSSEYAPPLTETTSVEFSSHTGTAICGDEDDEIYATPHVPDTAVRRGFVVGEESTFVAAISGLGSSGIVNLVDGTQVSVQAGECELPGTECEMQVTEAVFRANPFSIDGRAATGVTLRLADAGTPATYRNLDTASEFDDDHWFVEPTAPLNMEFFGNVEGLEREDGRPIGLDVEWFGAEGPALLNRSSPLQFMRFQGSMSRDHDFGDGTRTVSVEADFLVSFFSGHPTALMLASEAPSGMLILDGRHSSDMLGGTLRDYRWVVRRDTGMTLLALGPLVGIPAPIWEHIQADKNAKICLRIQDTDDMYDEKCMGIGTFPTPELPPPEVPCGSLATTFPDARRFGALLQASGLTDYLNQFQGITLLVPDDGAMSEMKDEEYEATLKDKQKAQQEVLNHAYAGVYLRKDLAKLYGKLPLGKLKVDPGKLPDDARIPDVDCGGGALHMSSSRSRAL